MICGTSLCGLSKRLAETGLRRRRIHRRRLGCLAAKISMWKRSCAKFRPRTPGDGRVAPNLPCAEQRSFLLPRSTARPREHNIMDRITAASSLLCRHRWPLHVDGRASHRRARAEPGRAYAARRARRAWPRADVDRARHPSAGRSVVLAWITRRRSSLSVINGTWRRPAYVVERVDRADTGADGRRDATRLPISSSPVAVDEAAPTTST